MNYNYSPPSLKARAAHLALALSSAAAVLTLGVSAVTAMPAKSKKPAAKKPVAKPAPKAASKAVAKKPVAKKAAAAATCSNAEPPIAQRSGARLRKIGIAVAIRNRLRV